MITRFERSAQRDHAPTRSVAFGPAKRLAGFRSCRWWSGESKTQASKFAEPRLIHGCSLAPRYDSGHYRNSTPAAACAAATTGAGNRKKNPVNNPVAATTKDN